MPKTITITICPPFEETDDILIRSGLLQMLQDTGACIDRKKDKALQGKVELSINEVDISFTAKEICDKAGNMNEAIRTELDEWIFTHVANQ